MNISIVSLLGVQARFFDENSCTYQGYVLSYEYGLYRLCLYWNNYLVPFGHLCTDQNEVLGLMKSLKCGEIVFVNVPDGFTLPPKWVQVETSIHPIYECRADFCMIPPSMETLTREVTIYFDIPSRQFEITYKHITTICKSIKELVNHLPPPPSAGLILVTGYCGNLPEFNTYYGGGKTVEALRPQLYWYYDNSVFWD